MAAFAAPLIGMGISALTGLFGNKKPQQTTTNTTSTSTPDLDPQEAFLKNLIGNGAINDYKNGAPDLSGYTANGLQNINKAGDMKSKIASNIVASRGLSFSPSSVQNLINPENDRLSQSTDFLNTIPLLKRQFEQQNLAQLMQSFSLMPKGSTTTSNSTQTGNPANPVAGTLSGAGQGLFAALPYLQNAFKGGGSTPGAPGYNPANADFNTNSYDEFS